ncbi:hypothetical protein L9F63_000405 [Diploptera punctata]|uniref:Uncharacterized protein n=1 Tax=Diploptera punctata TaxID=6984 RepID=A0AAD8ESQ8_DIPPU|nr:hypothetical protein L9F63_000405 [Diploptera punctata]
METSPEDSTQHVYTSQSSPQISRSYSYPELSNGYNSGPDFPIFARMDERKKESNPVSVRLIGVRPISYFSPGGQAGLKPMHPTSENAVCSWTKKPTTVFLSL